MTAVQSPIRALHGVSSALAQHLVDRLANLVPGVRSCKPEMISKTPMTISQMPTTRVSVTSDSKGELSTTTPAMIVMMPKKMLQPRPGFRATR